MGDLTQCNFCSLKGMKERAKAKGVMVILGVDSEGWITARYSNESEPSAWFMTLTKSCVC